MPDLPAPMCTGISAFWCPVHGDCTCERAHDGECCFDNNQCPLHGDASDHAQTVKLADCEQRITALASELGSELNANDHRELSRFAQLLHERSRYRA